MPVTKFRTTEERDKVQAEMLELRKQGLTYDEIAEKVGVSMGTVGYYLTVRPSKKPNKFVSVVRAKRHVNGRTEDTTGIQVSFAAGYTRAWLEGYAREHGLPAGELVKSVTSILGEN